jgi:hypothetical protein
MLEAFVFSKLKETLAEKKVNVYPGFVNENKKRPAVFYTQISQTPVRTLNAISIYRFVYQVTILSESLKEAKELSFLIRQAFNDAIDESYSGLRIIDCVVTNETVTADTRERSTATFFIIDLDVRIIVEEVS